MTVEACNIKLDNLAALAPGFTYESLQVVKNRAARTRVSRDSIVRSLQLTTMLRLREYDREARVRDIDDQWLAIRGQRWNLQITARRRRPRDAEVLPRNQRRRYETATDCALCLLTLSEGPVADLLCGHQLHTECLLRLEQEGDERCPNCRGALTSSLASPSESLSSLNRAVEDL